MTKLTKLPPAWHSEAAEMLRKNFDGIHAAFVDGTKKAVALGLFLNAIKQRGKEEGSIPHGEFGPWCQKNVPEITFRHLQRYMALATGVLEFGKLELGDLAIFADGGQKRHLSLLTQDGQKGHLSLLSASGLPLPPEVEKLIDGKTQKELFLQFHSEKPPAEYHPPKPMTADEVVRAEKETAEEFAKSLIRAMNVIMDSETWSNLSRVFREEIEDRRLDLGHFIKAHTRVKP